MFLIDTNVVSELRKTQKADGNVLRWAKQQGTTQQFLSVVTLQELQYGILLKMQRDQADAAKLSDWLRRDVIPRFAGQILVVDERVALQAAALHVPKRRPERDAWIAATALVHGLTVVTRNVRDFAGIGVKIIDPWDTRSFSAPQAAPAPPSESHTPG